MVTGERRPLVRKQQQPPSAIAFSTQSMGPQQRQPQAQLPQQQYYRMSFSGPGGGAPGQGPGQGPGQQAQRAQHVGSTAQTRFPNYAPATATASNLQPNPMTMSNYAPGGAPPVNYVSHRGGGGGGGSGEGGLSVQSVSVPFHARRLSGDPMLIPNEADQPPHPHPHPATRPAGGASGTSTTSTTTFPVVRASLPLVAQNPGAPVGAGAVRPNPYNPYSLSAREQLEPSVGDEIDEVDEVCDTLIPRSPPFR